LGDASKSNLRQWEATARWATYGQNNLSQRYRQACRRRQDFKFKFKLNNFANFRFLIFFFFSAAREYFLRSRRSAQRGAPQRPLCPPLLLCRLLIFWRGLQLE
jgi:hypothetical protein